MRWPPVGVRTMPQRDTRTNIPIRNEEAAKGWPRYNAKGFELGIRNQSALVANFNRINNRCRAEIQQAVKRNAEKTRIYAYRICPVDTRFMREHIKVKYGPQMFSYELGWLAEDFIAEGLPFYPVFVEGGTHKMAARPVLLPAHRRNEGELRRDVAIALQRGAKG